ncbi:trypsin-like peptidase [Humitalea rosea]|uniref:Trypsin-like peptidase n=1 Tax=Humitalea rosea TaxID=990373 RepID=A0A2W7I790_9PROT|nr:serine protease [Humitalea rosea]PZW42129.1 trypsin-like peptidase [Humitalea rosea]
MRSTPILAALLCLATAAPALSQSKQQEGGQRPGKGGARAEQAALPPKPEVLPPGVIPPQAQQIGSGSGFVVGEHRVMTNHHVVEACTYLRLRRNGGQEVDARLIRADRERDLALIATEEDVGPTLAFRSGPEVRRGEDVITYGYPLAGLLSAGPTLTAGSISALTGIGDNARQYQISVPVQPGNSGGPLLDLGGHVVGIVVSKLNAQRVAQRTGDIPQNVNFAVKSSEAVAFLQGLSVPPAMAETTTVHSAAEAGEIADASTVLVRCLR